VGLAEELNEDGDVIPKVRLFDTLSLLLVSEPRDWENKYVDEDGNLSKTKLTDLLTKMKRHTGHLSAHQPDSTTQRPALLNEGKETAKVVTDLTGDGRRPIGTASVANVIHVGKSTAVHRAQVSRDALDSTTGRAVSSRASELQAKANAALVAAAASEAKKSAEAKAKREAAAANKRARDQAAKEEEKRKKKTEDEVMKKKLKQRQVEMEKENKKAAPHQQPTPRSEKGDGHWRLRLRWRWPWRWPLR
jgi:hypothetical protein